MGHSNYELTTEQKKQLDKFADNIICKIEDELLMNEIDILDPYLEDGDGEIDDDKLTAMLWYIGNCICVSTC